MSAPGPAEVFRWSEDDLRPVDPLSSPGPLHAAESFLVDDGRALALELHRSRFADALRVAEQRTGIRLAGGMPAFWAAAIARIPREGAWFPRIELGGGTGSPELRLRLRRAPSRGRSVTVVSHDGADPRTVPTVKGPDLEALMALRADAEARGAGEVAILSPDGYVVEGTTTGLVWWRGDMLAVPAPELDRVDSVTVRSLVGLATALGVETLAEHATPAELDGAEVWALNALHGIRIVTSWQGGPGMAEAPGRLGLWRRRLDALRRPLP